jgi:hypothetical protein
VGGLRGTSLVADAERLFPVETVIAVMEALRYDVTEGVAPDDEWLDGIVRCEARDFIAARVVSDAVRAGVEPWLIVDHLETIAAQYAQAEADAGARAIATSVLDLIARHRRGDDYDGISDELPACPRPLVVDLAVCVHEAAITCREHWRGRERLAQRMADSILDFVRCAYALPGYGAATAQSIIEHAAREAERLPADVCARAERDLAGRGGASGRGAAPEATGFRTVNTAVETYLQSERGRTAPAEVRSRLESGAQSLGQLLQNEDDVHVMRLHLEKRFSGRGSVNAYQKAVAQYLKSEEGRDTPELIAARMMKLDHISVGMGPYPVRAQIHNTRVALEDLERMQRQDMQRG